MALQHIFLFFNLGGGEIFLILLVILLFFGSKRLPELARGLGKGIRELKDAASGIEKEIKSTEEDLKKNINQTDNSKS